MVDVLFGLVFFGMYCVISFVGCLEVGISVICNIM